MTIFCDGFTARDIERKKNIEMLEKSGFEDGGTYSTSGSWELEEMNYGGKISFGTRCNNGGKGFPKYFTLVKKFSTIEKARKEFKKLTEKLEIKGSK